MASLQVVRLWGWLFFLLHFFIRFFNVLFFLIILPILICVPFIIFFTVFRLLFIIILLLLFHNIILTLWLIFIHFNFFFLLEHLLRHSPVNCHSSAKKLSSICSLNSSSSILYFLELNKSTTNHSSIRFLENIYIYHRTMWREELLQRILIRFK